MNGDPANPQAEDPRLTAARERALVAYDKRFADTLDYVRDGIQAVLKDAADRITDEDKPTFAATVLAPVVHTIAQVYLEALPVNLMHEAVAMRLAKDTAAFMEAGT